MSKKRTTINGAGHKFVKGIIVLFTLEGLKKVACDTQITIACYGDAALADIMAMDKILTALAKGESKVMI